LKKYCQYIQNEKKQNLFDKRLDGWIVLRYHGRNGDIIIYILQSITKKGGEYSEYINIEKARESQGTARLHELRQSP